MIHFWMIPSMLLNHPKLDDLYDPFWMIVLQGAPARSTCPVHCPFNQLLYSLFSKSAHACILIS